MARLASEACERRLSWRERWRMRWHYIICDWCRRYAWQLQELHQLAPRLLTQAPQLHRRTMPEATRVRLKQKLIAENHE